MAGCLSAAKLWMERQSLFISGLSYHLHPAPPYCPTSGSPAICLSALSTTSSYTLRGASTAVALLQTLSLHVSVSNDAQVVF